MTDYSLLLLAAVNCEWNVRFSISRDIAGGTPIIYDLSKLGIIVSIYSVRYEKIRRDAFT